MELETFKSIIPQFTDLRLLEEMAHEGNILKIEAGKSIMEPGMFIKMVPIVLEGSIKVIRMDEDGRELFLYYLQPGQTCALSLTCCKASKPSEIKAVAEEDSIILAIPVSLHEKWMKG